MNYSNLDELLDADLGKVGITTRDEFNKETEHFVLPKL
jgi:hypothetical protein